MSNLPPGMYRITTAIQDGTDVGRSRIEDLSLIPKTIVCCDPSWDVISWVIQPVEAGKYVLRARGSVTGIFNNNVAAYLLDEAPVQWYIRPVEAAGSDMYTISNSDGKAWELSGTEVYTKVACKDLIISPDGMSPKNQLWHIIPLIDAD